MKNFLMILITLFSAFAFAVPNQLPNDDTILGRKSASGTAKRIIFENNKGASNTQIFSNPVENDLTASSTAVKIKSPSLSVGTGNASATPTVKFDNGAVSQPAIKYNPTTQKIEFTNDGLTFKGIGSGSGGAGGLNLLENFDFEGNVTTGWLLSNATASQLSYTIGTTDNQKYAFVSSTAVGGYYESAEYQVTDILNGQDCELNFNYQSTAGAWRAEVFSSGTVVASQTIASATNWVAGPKIFYPCGSTASTTTKVRFTNLASGTLALDDVYLGSIRSLKNGAIITAWQPLVTATTGFGTIVNSTLFWRQNGNTIQIKGSFQTGTVAGTPGTIALPPGFVIKASEYTAFRHSFGQAWRLGGGTNTLTAGGNAPNLAFVYNGNNGVIQVAYQIVNALYANNNADTMLASGDFVNIELLTITVEGTTGSNTTFDSRCPNDISCTNEFTADVNTAGTVTNESLDFLNGNCSKAGTGVTNCVFNAGVFTIAPSVTPVAITTAGGNCVLGSPAPPTSGTFQVLCYATSNNAAADISFNLTVVKKGADFVAKRTVEGFLSKVLSNGATIPYRSESATINGSAVTYGTACSTGTCINFASSSNWITVVFNSTGVYTGTFAAGTFSGPPTCYGTAGDGDGRVLNITNVTSSTVNLRTALPGGVQNSPINLTCTGPR